MIIITGKYLHHYDMYKESFIYKRRFLNPYRVNTYMDLFNKLLKVFHTYKSLNVKTTGIYLVPRNKDNKEISYRSIEVDPSLTESLELLSFLLGHHDTNVAFTLPAIHPDYLEDILSIILEIEALNNNTFYLRTYSIDVIKASVLTDANIQLLRPEFGQIISYDKKEIKTCLKQNIEMR